MWGPSRPSIGLWIARRLVARLGGTITAISPGPGPGLGNEFVVRLPLDAPTPEPTLHSTNDDALLMAPALGS